VEFRQIRYALAVAKERSFSKGAARSNISQSAVSEQVKLLEGEIGFPLFRRTSRGVEVTDRGRSFLQQAEKIVNDMIDLSDAASRLRGEVSDTFTMGIASGVDQILIPRLFKNVNPLKSRMRLAIVTAPTRRIFDDLYEERIDAGVAIESDPARVPAGLRFERLVTAELVLIAHPKHPLAKSRKPIDVSSLAGEPLVMSEMTIGYGEIVLSMFANLGLKPNIFAVADNIATMKSIIQLGKGVAIVPRACVASEVALGVLCALAITPKRDAVFSLIQGRQQLSQRKERFIATLRESLRD
jgi:DNA-binding transcriptional LysR family regulator